MPLRLPRALSRALCAAPVLLAACGGGGDGGGVVNPPLDCSTAGQQNWLRGYMADWYFWYRLSPSPAPGGFATVDAYFDALLYGGGDLIPGSTTARWPSDRYSFSQTTESFNRFFGDGQTLGYGVAVNGLEAVAQGATRLFVRYVEPSSPAALSSGVAGGVTRGDEILALNGTPVATLIANNDFAALTANNAGDTLRLDIRRATGSTASVTLTAAVFGLTPVQNHKVLTTPGGRKLGYVFVKDMVSQAGTPLASAMTSFKNQGVQDLVLDLRYNGGGLVSVGNTVASYVGGAAGSGQRFSRLLYNDRHQGSNQDYLFSNPNAWAGFNRVYVLMGERTCSASEQVINGLRGIGVNVVGIGDTTCGKPVGFLPQGNSCGTTYSVVNFESINARNEGRYFDGLQATCVVAENFARPIGDNNDPLLVAGAAHIDTGLCPAGTALREQPLSRSAATRARYTGADGGERTGMSAR
jgi:carboxyl-terminal processing protease